MLNIVNSNLNSELAGKAAAEHEHDMTDVTGLDDALAACVSPGIVMPFAGAGAVPEGYLICDGAAVSRTAYAALFLAIGTAYGEGDGSTTFLLPDYRGKFLRGYLNGTTAEIGTAQGDAIRNITGSFWNEDYWSAPNPRTTGAFVANAVGHGGSSWAKTASFQPGGFDFNASLVVPTADENRPANYAVQYIIKY